MAVRHSNLRPFTHFNYTHFNQLLSNLVSLYFVFSRSIKLIISSLTRLHVFVYVGSWYSRIPEDIPWNDNVIENAEVLSNDIIFVNLCWYYIQVQFFLIAFTVWTSRKCPSSYFDAIFPRIIFFLHPLLYLNFILHPLFLLLLLLLLDSLSLMQPRAGPEGRTPIERSPLAPHYVTLLSTIPQKLLNRSGRNLIQYFMAYPCIIVQNFRKIWFYKVFGFLVTFGVWTLPAARCGSSYSEEDMAKENQCFISAPPNSVKSSESRQVGVTRPRHTKECDVWHFVTIATQRETHL